MLTNGKIVVKQEIKESFDNDVVNYLKNLIVWCTENPPNGNTDTTIMSKLDTKNLQMLPNIQGEKITAEQIIQAVQTVVKSYSSIRNLLYTSYLTHSGNLGTYYTVSYKDTKITRMAPNYEQQVKINPTAYGIEKGKICSAVGLNNFFNQIKIVISSLINNSTNLDYYYCHAHNQHASHSNRGRR